MISCIPGSLPQRGSLPRKPLNRTPAFSRTSSISSRSHQKPRARSISRRWLNTYRSRSETLSPSSSSCARRRQYAPLFPLTGKASRMFLPWSSTSSPLYRSASSSRLAQSILSSSLKWRLRCRAWSLQVILSRRARPLRAAWLLLRKRQLPSSGYALTTARLMRTSRSATFRSRMSSAA